MAIETPRCPSKPVWILWIIQGVSVSSILVLFSSLLFLIVVNVKGRPLHESQSGGIPLWEGRRLMSWLATTVFLAVIARWLDEGSCLYEVTFLADFTISSRTASAGTIWSVDCVWRTAGLFSTFTLSSMKALRDGIFFQRAEAVLAKGCWGGVCAENGLFYLFIVWKCFTEILSITSPVCSVWMKG